MTDRIFDIHTTYVLVSNEIHDSSNASSSNTCVAVVHRPFMLGIVSLTRIYVQGGPEVTTFQILFNLHTQYQDKFGHTSRKLSQTSNGSTCRPLTSMHKDSLRNVRSWIL